MIIKDLIFKTKKKNILPSHWFDDRSTPDLICLGNLYFRLQFHIDLRAITYLFFKIFAVLKFPFCFKLTYNQIPFIRRLTPIC